MLTLASTFIFQAARAEDLVPEWLTRSRLLAQQLGTELKAELSSALASTGPTGAISVCRTRAPEIAAKLSRESGALVSRTALRVRNPANAPDDLQHAILEQFADDLATGRAETPLEAAVEINRGGKIEHRYMRAIPMDGVCLTCHGQQLAPDVASAIARDYPDDQAIGFEQGQLRGAFSVIWPASPPASNR
jgi:hypothetical protein